MSRSGPCRCRPRGPISRAGFTLIELMIVLVIVGILLAIAIPSYEAYIVRSNRAEGKAAILAASHGLERCYTRFVAYNSADCTMSFPFDSDRGSYRITVARTATSYTLTATPQGAQADRDGVCGAFTLNQTGVRGIGGSGAVGKCW
jgi:type IV pilus assembly protein PilE